MLSVVAGVLYQQGKARNAAGSPGGIPGLAGEWSEYLGLSANGEYADPRRYSGDVGLRLGEPA